MLDGPKVIIISPDTLSGIGKGKSTSTGASMEFWAKHNLHILTVAGIAVAAYLAIGWDGMEPVQRSIGLFIVGVTLHEWEEMRFPGGFFGLMSKMFGIKDATELQMEKAHGAVAIAIVFFAYVPFFLHEIAWLAMVPAILGIFESFIHVAGIKIHRLKRPYSPGMATALLILLPSAVCIIAFGAQGMPAWEWLLSIAYYLATFLLMEVCVWGAFGISPKELPDRAKGARAYVLGKRP